jgi:hypothetical protein
VLAMNATIGWLVSWVDVAARQARGDAGLLTKLGWDGLLETAARETRVHMQMKPKYEWHGQDNILVFQSKAEGNIELIKRM